MLQLFKQTGLSHPLKYLFLPVLLLVGNTAHGYQHAFAQFGDPKYPEDFTHFEYVNPDAPKCGVLNLSNTGANSSFDKFNPFSLKGRPAPGLLELMFETLTVYSLDERNTQYGLLAKDIIVDADFTGVTFRLHPQARFSNGDPVTAYDVKYSYDTLTASNASPIFRSYFAEIAAPQIIDSKTVYFAFTRKGRDLPFVAGSLPVFSPKWGVSPDGERTDFDKLRHEHPVTSGPYLIERAVESRGITYRRNPDYWGANIPVRRGTLNFDSVVYKLYKDRDTQVSALRAGQYDFFMEHQMRYWCCQYIGHRFKSGELIKEKVPHKNPPAMVGHGFNLRHERFQDPKVREALNHALDFEWVNQKIFDNQFNRVYSYFATTELEASGLPGPEELAILEPYRDQLDPAVFGTSVELPSTKPPSSLRKNLMRALDLFEEAGWTYRDGALRNAAGEPFVIEVSGSRGGNMLLDPYYLNLTKIGIDVRHRNSDAATSRALMSSFDFDFAPIGLRESRMPGAELWRKFNSADADKPGSENILGVKSPVVDALITQLLDANSYDELKYTGRALDRVLMHSHYIQPWRYLTNHHIIHHQRLKRPEILPLYYNAYEWVISTWWDSSSLQNSEEHD